MIKQISVVVLSIAAITAAGNLTGCYQSGANEPEKGKPMPEKTIEEVLNERTDEWMAIPGVVGTAIGLFQDRPCIKIFTSSNPEQIRDKIPSSVENYPVIVQETGAFRALDQQ